MIVKFIAAAVLFVASVFSLEAGQRIRLDYRQPQLEVAARSLASAQTADLESVLLRRTCVSASNVPTLDRPLQNGDELAVNLFEDKEIVLTLKEESASPLGGASFLASADGYGDVRNAVVVQLEDGLQIDIQDYVNSRVYSVYTTANGASVSEIEPTNRPRVCGIPPVVTNAESLISRKVSLSASNGLSPKCSESADSVYVDLLVVYEKGASEWLSGSGSGTASAFAEVAVQKMNTALANTGLDSHFRFRLVGVREVEGRAATGYTGGQTISAILESIVSGGTLNGYAWSALHEMREEVEADIVCVLTDTGYDYGVTGTGFSLTQETASYFARQAYNCCAIRAVAQNHTMTHEVGHNMGAGHSDAMADKSNCGPQYYEYSSGFYFYVGETGYYTIMAYSGDGYGNHYTEVPYFSSPDHSYRGVTVGDYFHDNTRTLKNNFLLVSRFRGWVEDASSVGEAIEAGDYAWETSGNYPWSVISDAYTAGFTAARSCEMAGDTTSWLRTTVVGPATLTFDYQMRTYGGRFAVECDSTVLFEQKNLALPNMSWDDVSLEIPSGRHVVKFSYTHPNGGYTSGWGNGVRLDNVLFSDGRPPTTTCNVTFDANGGSCSETNRLVTIGNAVGSLPTSSRSGYTFDGWYTSSYGGSQIENSTIVDGNVTYYAHWTQNHTYTLSQALNSMMSFSTGGSAPWYAQTSTAYDDVAAQSGFIGNSESSWMEVAVIGSGTLDFRWKVSSESDYDFLTLTVDGMTQDSISGIGGSWVRKSVSVTGSGSHTIRWTYSKDGSDHSGSDCGWVDCVSWTSVSYYTVRFNANGGSAVADMQCESGNVYKLPACSSIGKRLVGWRSSSGKRYDIGMLFFDLAQPGEIVTMTAIWEEDVAQESVFSGFYRVLRGGSWCDSAPAL